jgi:hypothetical protein
MKLSRVIQKKGIGYPYWKKKQRKNYLSGITEGMLAGEVISLLEPFLSRCFRFFQTFFPLRICYFQFTAVRSMFKFRTRTGLKR